MMVTMENMIKELKKFITSNEGLYCSAISMKLISALVLAHAYHQASKPAFSYPAMCQLYATEGLEWPHLVMAMQCGCHSY